MRLRIKVLNFVSRFAHAMSLAYFKLITLILYKPRFGSIGQNSIIFGNFVSLHHPEYVFLGKSIRILKNARIDCLTNWRDQNFTPKIVIRDNVNIGQNFFISCAAGVEISSGVLISDNVAIIDNEHVWRHGSSLSNTPIKLGAVMIQPNVTVYRNSTILPGTIIEEGAIIGANSVVSGMVRANCLYAGAPATLKKELSDER